MGRLAKHTFFVLHQEIFNKADELCGGLNREYDYTLYGEGKGAGERQSIAYVVRSTLVQNEYPFKNFTQDSNSGKLKFSGTALRKAKNRYNNSAAFEEVFLEDMYIDAYLTFLGKSMEDLEMLAKDYVIEEEINLTKSTKPKKDTMPKQNLPEERTGKQFELLIKHFHDNFYMYSYNEKWNKIYKAVLEIRPEGSEIKVRLINSESKGLPYFGVLDYKLIDEYILSTILHPYLRNKGLFIILSVNLNKEQKANFYQGQLLRFGKETELVSSNVFLERFDTETGTPKIYKTDDPELPEHVHMFFDPPVFNITDKKQFKDLEDFMKWLKKKKVL